MRKVKIKNLPQAYKGGSMSSLYKQIAPSYMTDSLSEKPIKGKKTLGPVPREMANLEAEKGETAFIPDVDGLPAHYKIGGQRHYAGGTPLNLPDNSFIFSDTSSMKIKDQDILKEFNMPKKKGGYTPAQIAEKYDLNKYREVLGDPNSDKLSRETAEKMISSYNVKLAKLALIQESKKGFPDGIPAVALPYMAMNAIQPQDVLPIKEAQGNPRMMQDERAIQEEENPTEQQFEASQENPYAKFGGIANKIKDNPLLKKVYAKMGGIKRQFKPESGIYMYMEEGGPVFKDGYGTTYSKNNSDVDIPAYFGYGTNYPVFQDGGTKKDGKYYDKDGKEIDPSKIKKLEDPAIAVGDYYLDGEGKLRKVTKVLLDQKKITNQSLSGKANYKPVYGSLEDDVRKANEIMQNLEKEKLASKDSKGNWTIYRGAADKISIADKDFLTGLSSYNKDEAGKNLGAPGFNIASQSTYETSDRSKKRDDGFYGYADPKMVEFRFWQASNPGKSAEEFDKLDDEGKFQNRKTMMSFYYTPDELAKMKVTDESLKDPNKFYTKDFITNKETGLVKRNQEKFETAGYRSRLGDDYKFGLEHLDRYYFGQTPEGELVPQKEDTPPEKDLTIPAGELETTADKGVGPEWWLQDVIKTAGAAGDMARVKKRLPWSPKLSPYVPEPTFYDPTRELAATQEQFNIGTQGAAAYAPSQAYNARYSQMAGQGAKAAADILGRYNNLNVSTANNFAATKAQIVNEANAANAEITKNLFDQTTVANQQYDNAKAQARQELRQSYIDAITNKEQAYALNQMYPNYQISPSQGGRLFFNKGEEMSPADLTASDIEQFKSIRSSIPNITDDAVLKLMGKTTGNDNNFADTYLQMMQGVTPGSTNNT
jgi:hypothetical protein